MSPCRRSFRHDATKPMEIPWEAVGGACLTAVLLIAMILYFFVDNGAFHLSGPPPPPPASSKVEELSSSTPHETTTSNTGGRDLLEADFDSIPSVPAIPDVLLCGTSGRGNRSLPDAITAHCTHAIFTGPILLRQDDYGSLFLWPQDQQAFSTFLEVKDPVKKYASLPCALFENEYGSEVAAIASKFFSQHGLVGLQLRVESEAQLDVAVSVSKDFQKIHPGEFNTVLWLAQPLLPNETFFDSISATVEFIVFESQRLLSDKLHSLRFPNPYGPFPDGADADVFLERRVSRMVPLQRRLEANAWCFSISLSAIKCVKDTLYSQMVRISAYFPVPIAEVCEQLLVNDAKYSSGALSRYVETESVFYGYDDRTSLVAKLSKLLFRCPGFCVSVYDVEADDLDDRCRRTGVDVGTPLLRVLSQLVTARTSWKRIA